MASLTAGSHHDLMALIVGIMVSLTFSICIAKERKPKGESKKEKVKKIKPKRESQKIKPKGESQEEKVKKRKPRSEIQQEKEKITYLTIV